MDTHRILQKYVFMLVFKIRILLSLDMSIHTCGLSLDMRPDSLFGPVSPRMPYPKAKPLSFLYDARSRCILYARSGRTLPTRLSMKAPPPGRAADYRVPSSPPLLSLTHCARASLPLFADLSESISLLASCLVSPVWCS
jgi:hypothetical protein